MSHEAPTTCDETGRRDSPASQRQGSTAGNNNKHKHRGGIMMTGDTKRYALVWDGIEHEGITIGTAVEVAKAYVEAYYEGFKVDRDEDGNLMYWLKDTRIGANCKWSSEWEEVDSLDDLGSEDANLKHAYEVYFRDYIEDESGYGDYSIYELTTPEQEAAFTAPIDDLLDKISFKEARDNDLDPDDDEMGVRAWYFENKAGGKAA